MIQMASFSEIMNLPMRKAKLNYKDLKKECIVRGMEFDRVINSDFPSLTNWLVNHVQLDKNISLLDEFDDYIDEKLRASGNHDLIHPSLRLGYVSNGSEDREKPVIKDTKPKEKTEVKKRSKKKDKNGIVKNTKKSLTGKLQGKGYPIEKVIKRVKRRFPDANEKSIKIWYRKFERSKKS